MHQILLVEDQFDYHVMITKILHDGQHTLTIASTAAEAKHLISTKTFELVLLDIGLPDQSGLELLAALRQDPATEDLPVIFLTGSDALPNKLTAFSLGAEDYIQKPINPLEFKARVDAKLRKHAKLSSAKDEARIGPFLFKHSEHRVLRLDNGLDLELTGRESRLLYYLAKNESRVMSREQILNEVWGTANHVGDRTVDSHIYTLRKKLGELGAVIHSITGTGYRFEPAKLAKNRTA